MIVRRLHEIMQTEREVMANNGNWISRRLLLHREKMGFSLHDTAILAGTETYIHYKNHVEAVYCVAGEGEIEDLETGEIHSISDGVLYALDNHERHYLRAKSNMRLICVFNPALIGTETHDSEGSYPSIQENTAAAD
uniref:L-ectoine synthase n=1 Tax=Candidatus Kentrum sp. LFY TaxID=2126342 RepID=A0A450UL22_9GAMM|nr:MAG: L-ectoine synthase [Candidatus Kentron sp. LFY]VFJ95671.1 MAG: L-ectoine synthase [Candidatus Kentron sp. LFY]